MIYLPRDASKARIREAQTARNNRAEIVKALSHGQISRRDLCKWGLYTAGGVLLAQNGFSPFAKSAYASSDIPTGVPRSIGPAGFVPFSRPLPRFNLWTPVPLARGVDESGLTGLVPRPGLSGRAAELAAQWGQAATRQSNTTPIRHTVNLATASNSNRSDYHVHTRDFFGPTEGRAPGEFFAHQRWGELIDDSPFGPVGYLGTLGQIQAGQTFFDLANSAINQITDTEQRLQDPNSVWPFVEGRFGRGVLPPPLVQARYGEPVILRNFCNLPFPIEENGGFGRNQPSIHNHNAHNGAESDGATNNFIFPGEYYDSLWSTMLARHDAGLVDSLGRDVDSLLNIKRGDPRCSSPTNDGGIELVPGDFREAQGSLWFHDHRFFFTAENVYKGFAAALEYFSGPDRGYERPGLSAAADRVNLRLPSGWRNSKTWGNRDFDVFLLVQDVALDPDGQLFFDIFEMDGFLGDVMHVNYQVAPVLEVLPRKYRFRVLSAGMSRWIQMAIVDSSNKSLPVDIIANDGNLLPETLRNRRKLDVQSTAERLDIVVDFSRGQSPHSQVGKEYTFVNILEFSNGKGPDKSLGVREALSGDSDDPCVGAVMKFRVVDHVESIDEPGTMNTIGNSCGSNDTSQVPDVLTEQIPAVEPVRKRVIEFVRTGKETEGLPFDHPDDGEAPWAIRIDGEDANKLDARKVSALIPRPGDVEHWVLEASGGGGGHPVHLHFEEGLTLKRKGGRLDRSEKGARKDVWKVGDKSGDVTIQVAFGEFGGAYVNHCHNTVHEDNAMLLRYDANNQTFRKPGDPVRDAGIVILPTPDPRPEGVTYVKSSVLPEGNPTHIFTGVDEAESGKPIGRVVVADEQDVSGSSTPAAPAPQPPSSDRRNSRRRRRRRRDD